MQVTRTFDFIRVMCVQYWPAAKNREEVYGGVGVTVETEEQLANFMIRLVHYSVVNFNSMYCQCFNSNVLSITVKKEIKYVFYLIVTGNKDL